MVSVGITGMNGYYLVSDPSRLVELWTWTRSLK
jgi:hypothetical protein